MAKKKTATPAVAPATKPRPHLRHPKDLSEEIQLPQDILFWLGAGRPEMLKTIPPRPCTAEEFQALVNALRVLAETNQILQERVRVTAEAGKLALTNAQGATERYLMAAIDSNRLSVEKAKGQIDSLADFQSKKDLEGPEDESCPAGVG